jgi:hypothetical protein
MLNLEYTSFQYMVVYIAVLQVSLPWCDIPSLEIKPLTCTREVSGPDNG